MGKCTTCKFQKEATEKKCNQCQGNFTKENFTANHWQHKGTDERICIKCSDAEKKRILSTIAQKYYCDKCKQPINMQDQPRSDKRPYRYEHGERRKQLTCDICTNLAETKEENPKKEIKHVRCVICTKPLDNSNNSSAGFNLSNKEKNLRTNICSNCVQLGYTSLDWKGSHCSKCNKIYGHRWYKETSATTQRLCQKCHKPSDKTIVTCARCHTFLSLQQLAGSCKETLKSYRKRYDTQSHICHSCKELKYTPKDIRTYTCRFYETCKTKQGREAFEETSVRNFLERQLLPICHHCNKQTSNKSKTKSSKKTKNNKRTNKLTN